MHVFHSLILLIPKQVMDEILMIGIPTTKKKFAELELSLVHLQQNIAIPSVVLVVHPTVQEIVDQNLAKSQKATVSSFAEYLSDTSFLNKLQSNVNQWIREIQKVTKLTKDHELTSASQEINFWISLETALDKIDEKLQSEEIILSLEILKAAKRFHATVSFLADTGLKEAMDLVYKYNQLMKEFPLNELLSATDLSRIKESIILIFQHLNKKLKICPYPIKRALSLVESISSDLNDQLIKVFPNRRLFYLPFEEFEQVLTSCEEIFSTWEEQLRDFINVSREVSRKRLDKFLPIRVTAAHAKFEERIKYVRNFRKQHEYLYATVGKVFIDKKTSGKTEPLLSASVLTEIERAYDHVKPVDLLDLSEEGTQIWASAEKAYNQMVSKVEVQIIHVLKDRLAKAKSASDMFRIFSKFNALFVRARIRGAIQEYQNQLIENVKEDIKKLHEKFKLHFSNSEAAHMSQILDLPPVSAAIQWASQIDRQLSFYMKRVEDILGKGWELYSEGQKLQQESVLFKKKLDTKHIFDQWLNDIIKRELCVSGRIFGLEKQKSGHQLIIQFDRQIIQLFKEVRNLQWLNFQIPHTVVSVARDAKRVYPFTVGLSESLRTYHQVLESLRIHPEIQSLVAGQYSTVQQYIMRGSQYRWDYFVNSFDLKLSEGKDNRYIAFVREFSETVTSFHEKTQTATQVYQLIVQNIADIQQSHLDNSSVALTSLTKIQGLIDQLSIDSFSNLKSWTEKINGMIEEALVSRLVKMIKVSRIIF
jgi:dynein heavy chain 1